MKSVNPFFTPAAKKCKYICEGRTHQAYKKEPFGQPSMERNNAKEGQSTSTEGKSIQGMKGLCWIANPGSPWQGFSVYGIQWDFKLGL